MNPQVIYDLSVLEWEQSPSLAFFNLLFQLVPLILLVVPKIFKLMGKTIGVLGMKEAGKTQLYRNLQNSPYNSYEGTSVDDYESFTFKHGDTKVKIYAGRDIGGGERYIKEYYKNMIEEKNIIFFVFNVAKYTCDENYASEVRARMDYIWRHLMEKYKNYDIIKTKLLTIGSHFDLIEESNQKSLLESLQKGIEDKPYSRMFTGNFILADLTKRNEFVNELIKSTIFG